MYSRAPAQTSILAAVATAPWRMVDEPVRMRPFVEGDLDAIVEFSVRAWAPIFASVRRTLAASARAQQRGS